MLVRCDDHPSIPDYRHKVNPVGYPDTAAICGRPGCTKPGRVLLKDDEWKLYQQGQHVIEGPNNLRRFG